MSFACSITDPYEFVFVLMIGTNLLMVLLLALSLRPHIRKNNAQYDLYADYAERYKELKEQQPDREPDLAVVDQPHTTISALTAHYAPKLLLFTGAAYGFLSMGVKLFVYGCRIDHHLKNYPALFYLEMFCTFSIVFIGVFNVKVTEQDVCCNHTPISEKVSKSIHYGSLLTFGGLGSLCHIAHWACSDHFTGILVWPLLNLVLFICFILNIHKAEQNLKDGLTAPRPEDGEMNGQHRVRSQADQLLQINNAPTPLSINHQASSAMYVELNTQTPAPKAPTKYIVPLSARLNQTRPLVQAQDQYAAVYTPVGAATPTPSESAAFHRSSFKNDINRMIWHELLVLASMVLEDQLLNILGLWSFD